MSSLTLDAENSVYTFETSELKGALRAQSPDPQVDIRHGISQLVHKPSGVSIINPKYSGLNLFRLFATHTGLGEPRLFERAVRVEGDTLIVNWGPADEHFASIEARYQVKEPNLIDLTITVCAEATYESYEIFLSNYFDPPLLAHVYLATDRYTREPGTEELVAPQENPIFKGMGLVYTRDAHAARRCVDGRWERKEMGHPTAQFRPAARICRTGGVSGRYGKASGRGGDVAGPRTALPSPAGTTPTIRKTPGRCRTRFICLCSAATSCRARSARRTCGWR